MLCCIRYSLYTFSLVHTWCLFKEQRTFFGLLVGGPVFFWEFVTDRSIYCCCSWGCCRPCFVRTIGAYERLR
jgi:hypothetical protein